MAATALMLPSACGSLPVKSTVTVRRFGPGARFGSSNFTATAIFTGLSVIPSLSRKSSAEYVPRGTRSRNARINCAE